MASLTEVLLGVHSFIGVCVFGQLVAQSLPNLRDSGRLGREELQMPAETIRS